MKLTSTAFNDYGKLPTKYTCEGLDISPPIFWQDLPPNTNSLVLIHDDPDAVSGVWDHWLLYNIPPSIGALPENVTTLPSGTKVGLNSWGQAAYGGACPPSGEHRYIFHLYALDIILSFPNQDQVTSEILRQRMQGHLLATATLTGLYQKVSK